MAKKADNDMQQVGFWALVSLTLGLAPFFPEPHIVGKLRWIAGGGVGMELMDYFDLLMHGFPWVMLGVAVVKMVAGRMGGAAPKAAKK